MKQYKLCTIVTERNKHYYHVTAESKKEAVDMVVNGEADLIEIIPGEVLIPASPKSYVVCE